MWTRSQQVIRIAGPNSSDIGWLWYDSDTTVENGIVAGKHQSILVLVICRHFTDARTEQILNVGLSPLTMVVYSRNMKALLTRGL